MEKNDVYDGAKNAIKHAKRRMAEYDKGGCLPSEYDPGTTAHILLEMLMDYLEE